MNVNHSGCKYSFTYVYTIFFYRFHIHLLIIRDSSLSINILNMNCSKARRVRILRYIWKRKYQARSLRNCSACKINVIFDWECILKDFSIISRRQVYIGKIIRKLLHAQFGGQKFQESFPQISYFHHSITPYHGNDCLRTPFLIHN